MNKKIRIALGGAWALLFVLCGAPDALRAQITLPAPAAAPAGARRLTLTEAIGLALHNDRAVLLAETEAAQAAAKYKEARAPFHPSVYVGSGLAGTKGFPLTLEGAAPSIFQVSGRESLLNRNLSNLAKVAGQMQAAAEKSLEQKRDDVVAQTVLTYLNLDRSRRSLQYIQRHTKSLADAEQIVKERVQAGLEAPLEDTKAQLDTARAQSTAVALQNQIAMLEFSLKDLTGIPQSQAIVLEAAEVPSLPADETLDHLVARAVNNNEGIKALAEEIRSKEFQVRAEQGTKWPRVDLVGQYGLFSDINNFSSYFRKFSRNNATVGFSVMVPLWDHYRHSAALSEAEAELAAARLRWADARAAVARQVRQEWGVLQEQAAARNVARLELEVARSSLDAVLAKFEDGRVNRLVVEQARSQEDQSWVNFLDTGYQADRARLELLRLTGGIRSAFSGSRP